MPEVKGSLTYNWDPKKSAENLRGRGFDFLFAKLFFDGHRLEKEDTGRTTAIVNAKLT